MEESNKLVVLGILGIITLVLPFGFILMWGPKRFEKKEKH
jgi:hypothetical protein